MFLRLSKALLLVVLTTAGAHAVTEPPASEGPLAPARLDAAKRLFEAQYSAEILVRQIERTLMAQFSAQMMNAASDDIMRRTEAFLPELAKRVSEDIAGIMYANAPIGALVFAERLTVAEIEASLLLVQSGAEPALDDIWLNMALEEARFRYQSGESVSRGPSPASARAEAETLLDVSGMTEALEARNIQDQSRQELLKGVAARLKREDIERLTAFYREGTGRKYFEARAILRDRLEPALQEAETLIQGHVQETCAALSATCEPSIFSAVFYPWRMQRTVGKAAP
jgi:hypothetical protein